jgi:hypothetical protein
MILYTQDKRKHAMLNKNSEKLKLLMQLISTIELLNTEPIVKLQTKKLKPIYKLTLTNKMVTDKEPK